MRNDAAKKGSATGGSCCARYPMKTFNLEEAAVFLHVHPETLRQSARAGRIPGAKVGRAWVAYLGELARTAGHTVACVAGVGRMGNGGDGAALRASERGASGAVCGSLKYLGNSGGRGGGHKLVTRLKQKGPAFPQALVLFGAPGRI